MIEHISKNLNLVLLGGGGVGKSFMIKKLKEKFKIISTASTGTASVNIDGCTIDSLFKLNQNKKTLLSYDEVDKKYSLQNNEFEENELAKKWDNY